jgi:Domain of unknown function (DUF2341)/Concanavalin A-like lectin/glucanases superfamily/Carbohydrate esterase, sialic acid-specific acetylesterase
MRHALFLLLATLFTSGRSGAQNAGGTPGQLPNWRHHGTLTLLTTPEGADLRAGAVVEEFPVLVRLHRDWFDFAQAKPDGADVRFTDSAGKALAYQIEEWDAAGGTASIWVRVPRIEGNARQSLAMHWGKADAASESNGKAVFNESNGYLSVWHLGDTVRDEVGTLESKDTGTSVTNGIIGRARHFPGKAGVFGGDKIPNYPTGASPHSSEVWFRTRTANSTLVGWGNEQGQGKVVMQLRSPPHIRMDCYFSGGDVAGSRLPLGDWTHVVHTYRQGESVIYVNGQPEGTNATKGSPLNIRTPARLWLGGWYNNYNFVGELDEVRISSVTRSADWVRLQYENQKPLQTLVGPLAQPGNAFSVSAEKAVVDEGKSVEFTAQAGGAQKVFWLLKRDGREEVVATDRFKFTFAAGRVTGDAAATLRVKAVFADGVKTKDIAITVKEAIPEPAFTLKALATWDGRATIEVASQVATLAAMRARGAGELKFEWSAGPLAVIKEVMPGKLRLLRAQNSGPLTVTATVSNGGQPTTQSVTIAVAEPKRDTWVTRVPANDEQPEDGQFFARDDSGEGTLHYKGTLAEPADAVFLKLFADEKLVKTETAKPGADKSFALAVKLKPGLVKYRVEFGTRAGGQETVLRRVGDLVCGDAFLIDGQSNALATDTGEKSPPETSEWIRSYGGPTGRADGAAWLRDRQKTTGLARPNLWCRPVWKRSAPEHQAELGWWGMELAKRLVASNQMPVCIIQAAIGGSRIDEHQASPADHGDLSTMYGRMLWRVRQARLTHGIRGILWHQGENDQGADGPTGGFGWESYHRLFIEMAGAWKQDFPNVQHYYVFQIWPNSCAMGGRDGAGDRLREKQRTLPQLFSNLSILSTLGVRPPGGCHFPLAGWGEFARMVQPLIERDVYGKAASAPLTAPNLRRVAFANAAKDALVLEFDQPVRWVDTLAGQFYLDGERDKVASGSVAGNVLTLKLKEPVAAKQITYLKEVAWNQDTLLLGANGLAALTFCEVPIGSADSSKPTP